MRQRCWRNIRQVTIILVLHDFGNVDANATGWDSHTFPRTFFFPSWKLAMIFTLALICIFSCLVNITILKQYLLGLIFNDSFNLVDPVLSTQRIVLQRWLLTFKATFPGVKVIFLSASLPDRALIRFELSFNMYFLSVSPFITYFSCL